MYIILSGIVLGFWLLWFAMSMMIRMNFYIKAVHQNSANKVVLTFDDGPHPTETLKVLEVLDEHNIKALFFLIGKNVAAHPEITKEIVVRGHQVGIHSQNHEWLFGFLQGVFLRKEIEDCQKEIEKATGIKTDLFRPPFGVTNPNVARQVKKLGLQTIGWNVRTYDTAAKNSSTIINKVAKHVNSNSIILLHDRVELTTRALPQIIEKVNGMGFAFGPLDLKN